MSASLPGDVALLVGAALLTAGVLVAGFAERLRAPALLLFLALGMAIGDDGLALIRFDDVGLTQRIGVVALVVILFEGGLTTAVGELRRVAAPAGLLATVGVVLTAAVVAGALLAATAVDPSTAILIGVVVASTDAAAVFAALRHLRLPPRVASLLEAESGANDPMAVLLTIGVIETTLAGASAVDWLSFGVRQLGGGVLVGLAVGTAGSAMLRSLRSSGAALQQALALGVAGLTYGVAAAASASGFLAVYVAGVVVASWSPRARWTVLRFHEGVASVAQIALFLLLGLLVFPARLPSVALTGLLVAAVLLFVARPLAVVACAAWSGLTRAEVAVVSWAGLRGAVPIVLATFPLTRGHPDGALVFDVVFFVVLVSAGVQGLTVGPLARRLGVAAAGPGRHPVAGMVPIERAGVDVVELEVAEGSGVVGAQLRDVPLPDEARVAAVLRGERIEVPSGSTRIAAGDVLFIVAEPHEHLADALAAWSQAG